MISLIKVLLLLGIFLLPLIGATPEFGFEQSKALWFILSISLIGFLWVIKWKELELKWTQISTFGAIFILALAVTSLIGIDPKISLLGKEPYFQGFILYLYLFLFYMMVFATKIKLEQWAYILIGSAVVVALVAIKDWILFNFLHQAVLLYAGRVVSSFGQPNFYAGYLVFCLPFLLLLKNHWLKLLVSVILMLGIVISLSKASFLALILLLFLLLIRGLSNKLRNTLIALVIAGLGLSVILSVLLNTGLYQYQIGQSNTKHWYINYSPEKREYIWPVVIDLIKQKPFLGYGLENLGAIFGTNLHPETPGDFPTHALDDVKNLYVDRAHNYILDLAIFSGGVGVFSWLLLIILLIRKLRQTSNGRSKFVLLISLITYLFWIQFQNQSVVHLVYFWLLLGLINSAEQSKHAVR